MDYKSDNKLFAALRKLNVIELNRFQKYISSPYFNINEAIIDYFEIIESPIKQGLEIKLSNHELWQKVFKKEKYANPKFLKLNSDLVKLLGDFVAQSEYDQHSSAKVNYKLEGIRKMNLYNLYNGVLNEANRLEKLALNKSADYYHTKYLIGRNEFNLKNENEKKNTKVDIKQELSINKIAENLDFYYIAEKLRLYCTLLSWQKMYNLEVELDNMDFVLSRMDIEKYEAIPPIQIYDKMHLTYVDQEDTKHYYELRELMKKYIHLFPIEEVKGIYETAFSYCINKSNKNVVEFYLESFNLYKEALEKEVIIIDGELSPSNFRNIVFYATRAGEIDWAYNFIKEYGTLINEKNRNNAINFSLARLEFYQKSFNKVIEHLNLITFENVFYNLDSRTLLAACYYELDEIDALEYQLNSFNQYIKREKSITHDRKSTYLNLTKFITMLIKTNSKDKLKLQKLKDEIVATKGVVSKPWLLEKVEALLIKSR